MHSNDKPLEIATAFLDQAEQDAMAANWERLPEEKRQSVVEAILAYGPEATVYVNSLLPHEVSETFVRWVISMRIAELKKDQALDCCVEIIKMLGERSYTRKTRDALIDKLAELQVWLVSI